MRLLTVPLVLLIVLVICPAAAWAGEFAAPRGVFTVQPGTFTSKGEFRVKGGFRSTLVGASFGMFRPKGSFRPEGRFTVPSGTFVPKSGEFRPSHDFRVAPGAFTVGGSNR